MLAGTTAQADIFQVQTNAWGGFWLALKSTGPIDGLEYNGKTYTDLNDMWDDFKNNNTPSDINNLTQFLPATDAYLTIDDFYNKINEDAAIQATSGTYTAGQITGHIYNTATNNQGVRLNQLKNSTIWEVYDTPSNTLQDKVTNFQYQVNNAGDKRIRLINDEGVAVSNFVYSDNITDLIVDLTKQSFDTGFESGYDYGFKDGYTIGYQDGFIDGANSVVGHTLNN